MNAQVIQAAEQQMRRSAPENPLSKRQKTGSENYQSVARYNYSSQESLQQGAQGFIITCAFRREKSATKEAVALLCRYLGKHPSLHAYSCIHTCFVFIGSIVHNVSGLKQSEALTTEAVPVTPTAHNAAASSSSISSASAAAASAIAAAATNPEQSASNSFVNTPASRCQYAFSITKLASSGIIMLQLHQQASHETIRYTSEQNHAQDQVAEQQDGAEALPANQLQLDSLPVTVVHQILEDLQAGILATPE
ncbi:TPA: hypothetical protein ACH3X1_003136 [Trebouxia sp. C0004]